MLAMTAALALSGFIGFGGTASARPEIGKTAPDFSAVDVNGQPVKLSDLRGKTVVLEWTNHLCPYVRKHYGAGNMQSLQKEATEQGVVWLTLNSSAPGEFGHVTPDKAKDLAASQNAVPTNIILDEKGTIGRSYEARTTPHMFIINASGELVFMGGIDSKPSSNAADIETADNYVRQALNEIANNQAVTTPVARPYGCSIKYAPEEPRS